MDVAQYCVCRVISLVPKSSVPSRPLSVMKRELSPLGLPWRVNMCVCTNGRVIECFAKSSVLIGAAMVACKETEGFLSALSDPERARERERGWQERR